MRPIACLRLASAISLFSLQILAQQPAGEMRSTDSELRPMPLVFEPNLGQAAPGVQFLAHAGGYLVLLEPSRTRLVLPPPLRPSAGLSPAKASAATPSVITLELSPPHHGTRLQASSPLPGKTNYFIGKDPSRWLAGIPQYAQVRLPSVYPGVDLLFYGNDGQLEYDFILSPGADPRALRFRIGGTDQLSTDPSGNLLLKAGNGSIQLHKPLVYQQTAGGRHRIEGQFVLRSGNQVEFLVGNYDKRQPLIVDPVLSYSTLIGANNSTQVQGIAVDKAGNAYITGTTFATNYPTVNAFQSVNAGTSDVFVTKLNPDGDRILYSTYLGGTGFNNAAAIAVDPKGSAYVTGTVGSSNFPTTPGAFMTTCPGICNTPFVTKFLTDGTLSFSTYMGGSNSPAHAMAVDSAGEVYIAGTTASDDLPATPGSYEPTYPGQVCTNCSNGYVEKLNASGTGLVYSTYFGADTAFGNVPSTLGSGIAVDSAGDAYLVGSTTAIPLQDPLQSGLAGGPNAFVAKFSSDGSQLLFSTYFGGASAISSDEAGDFATSVAVDPSDNVHVTGTTTSCEFPLSLTALSTDCVASNPDQKIFVVTLNSTGTQILSSTFLQSGNSPQIAVDKAGNSYVSGQTTSSTYPLMNPIESTSQLATATSFVTELSLEGNLLFSTYLGATGGGSSAASIAVDSRENIYVSGSGQGDFPLLDPIPSQIIQSTNYTFFVAKISPEDKPQLSLSPRTSPILALRNVSTVPLAISSIVPSPNFTMGGDCGSSLAAGAGCTLILEGVDDNKKSGTVTITSNATTRPEKFIIAKNPAGDTVGALISVFPAYLQFPAQLIGTASPAQQVVIQNTGLQAGSVSGIAINPPAPFAETNNCPALLNPGASCAISITYTAANAQDFGTLSIATNTTTETTVYLSGLGSSSALAPSTTYMDFGSQPVGGFPLGRIVNLLNSTPYPATITGIAASAGFAETDTCTAPLPPQKECRVSVTFMPTGNQIASGTLTISNYGPGAPVTVNLSATGVQPGALGLSPASLNFYGYAGSESAAGAVTLTNNTEASVPIQGISVGAPFSQTNTCGSSLAPEAACQISVAFTPTQPGSSSRTLQVSYSGSGSPQTMSLTGSAQTIVQFYPLTVQFPSQAVNVASPGYSLFVENFGPSTVNLGAITVQGSAFSISANQCGSTLARDSGCIVQVVFTPSVTGASTGSLSLTASDSSTPHTAVLQGIGISNGIGSLSVSDLSFKTQDVGTRSRPQKVTLTNTGTGPLVVGSISISPGFFRETNTCKAPLAPQASCSLSVFFTPSLQGLLAGSLVIQDNGANGQHTIALSGIGQ
jgi:hypothetical protein